MMVTDNHHSQNYSNNKKKTRKETGDRDYTHSPVVYLRSITDTVDASIRTLF